MATSLRQNTCPVVTEFTTDADVIENIELKFLCFVFAQYIVTSNVWLKDEQHERCIFSILSVKVPRSKTQWIFFEQQNSKKSNATVKMFI